MTTDIILDRIRQLGWTVSVHKVNQTVGMHAVHLAGEHDPQIARCNNGDGSDDEYGCACLLARAVGIDLEG